ncbi:malate dehydrogenase [candidate division WOR-1 bacterium RIFOXYA12_FULL_43_27]|uniref:Malate dehydrogenase n=1 Tax=candidate division WOR-1 bacterium RIFOXYC2_FULL_46_14 TaxID=1802587 RepID=A0A1F4U892_UNCSA|nr:MAG: malate dehydrogenase [candidate division WOR-1 bacterium RIFOXYA12_FULL_43_27]OGC20003.1 MAG: malate dehydrogenase [candidate division WOR-1 bacterium RIFOXYB2_FULL_46_45]OGC32260.1 MAG: malate dehydrogenase [candidate division WOR-1 bacterium RIFOXYA2_FULL_46_56]OGC41164.1 MAG: malate dehydrogenase [candidate division WOR-1 bacterium RIFOXYC2_FULL_46_14]
MPKLSVIGAGNVGATCAQRLVEKDLGDVVLVDIIEGIPQGKALDIYQSASIEGFSSQITGTNDFSEIKDSDVVVVTAGLARKPGMTREDLLRKNAAIITAVCENIKKYAPNSIIIMVSNPLDVMTQLAMKVTGFDPKRVVGMAGMLDSARLSAFIAMEAGCKPSEVSAMILGSHGDSMVTIKSQITVKGKLWSNDKLDALIERAKNGGAEIVAHLKTGSAFYAPSSGAAFMVEQIIKDKKDLIPCTCYLTGQYGLSNVYIGVPCRLGEKGIAEIVEIDLNNDELATLQKSANIVRQNFALLL